MVIDTLELAQRQTRPHMTAQTILLYLPVNYHKPITAKLLNSWSQAWEMMLSQNAMQLTLPVKEPAEALKDEREEGREFSGSSA